MRNGKSLTVSDFTIDLSAGELTGAVNSTTTRVAVFTLDLSEAKITTRGNTVTFTNVGLFAGGLRFGSAIGTVRKFVGEAVIREAGAVVPAERIISVRGGQS